MNLSETLIFLGIYEISKFYIPQKGIVHETNF